MKQPTTQTNMHVHARSLSHVQLCATPWTVASQAPLSIGFSRQEYWSELPFPSPGNLPDAGVEPGCSEAPALQADSLSLSHPESPQANTQRPIWLRAKRIWVLTRKDLKQTTHVSSLLSTPNVFKHVCSRHESSGDLSAWSRAGAVSTPAGGGCGTHPALGQKSCLPRLAA